MWAALGRAFATTQARQARPKASLVALSDYDIGRHDLSEQGLAAGSAKSVTGPLLAENSLRSMPPHIPRTVLPVAVPVDAIFGLFGCAGNLPETPHDFHQGLSSVQ